MSVPEAITYQGEDGVVEITAAADLASGQILLLDDGRAGVVLGLNAPDSGELAALATEGLFRVKAASGVTFAIGEDVYWDFSADTAINESSAIAEDFRLGPAIKAKVSGDLEVVVDFNVNPMPWNGVRQSRVVEFETTTPTALTTLIPAAWNKSGLIILAVYALVSEVFAGASQDQGIVTVKDTAGSPNTICTLTPSDAGADAAGDVIVGTAKIFGGATGDAVKTVAAGLGVTGQVTQQTSGSGAAGKMKVRVIFAPLY